MKKIVRGKKYRNNKYGKNVQEKRNTGKNILAADMMYIRQFIVTDMMHLRQLLVTDMMYLRQLLVKDMMYLRQLLVKDMMYLRQLLVMDIMYLRQLLVTNMMYLRQLLEIISIKITTKTTTISGRDMYPIQHYAIKLVNDLWQVGGFHRVHQSC